MPKFMSSHTVPAGALTREQINQIAQAAQNDPTVQPYRSFLNLSQGKIVCIMQAPDERALARSRGVWKAAVDVDRFVAGGGREAGVGGHGGTELRDTGDAVGAREACRGLVQSFSVDQTDFTTHGFCQARW